MKQITQEEEEDNCCERYSPTWPNQYDEMVTMGMMW
jgi:hypothetical protein